MSLGEKRAITVARAGCARAGAGRIGFCPIDTKDKAGAIGASGPHYLWGEHTLPTTTWTTVKE
jgi:hypothetical protein